MKKEIRLLIMSFALPFTATLGATAHYSLGIPGAPEMRVTTNASQNDWLSANTAYTAMSAVMTPGSTNAVSSVTVAGAPQVKQESLEAGFTLEPSSSSRMRPKDSSLIRRTRPSMPPQAEIWPLRGC